MANLTTERKTPKLGQDTVPASPTNTGVPMEASTKIYAGGLTAINAAGNAISAGTAGAILVNGVAEQTVDNSTGSAGAVVIVPRQGVFFFNNSAGGDAITNANAGQPCYVVDDNTVALTSLGGSRLIAGEIYAVDAAGQAPAGVWVQVGTQNGFGHPVFQAPGAVAAIRQVRGVVTANQANLAAFTGVAGGSPVDGITYVAGDRVLLVGQSTGSQNGIYVVGTVAAGSAPLTRPTDWVTGLVLPGTQIVVGPEGTAWANALWQVTTSGTITVGTTAVALYPKNVKGTVTLSGGAFNLTSQYILTGGVCTATDTTAAAAVKTVVTAGQGTGSVAFTGTTTDVIAYVITNF